MNRRRGLAREEAGRRRFLGTKCVNSVDTVGPIQVGANGVMPAGGPSYLHKQSALRENFEHCKVVVLQRVDGQNEAR
jgi:hypothetical protein